MKKIKTVICGILVMCLLSIIGYSGYNIWKINSGYRNEEKIHNEVMEYKPEEETAQNIEETVNQSIINLQKRYPDTLGWLTISNTKIDYPFVIYKDNDYYLHRDMNGKYASAGTIFMDYRCDENFTSQNTIIYGHHMKNGSVFGTLKNFNSHAFFEENTSGKIHLPHKVLELEIFAFIVMKSDDKQIYKIEFAENEKTDYLEYIRKSARHYRDIKICPNDNIVTLSTCAYEFNNARMAIAARVK